MRTAAEPSELRLAREAAVRAGVTRLADVTGLDRLGVPVFQAVRPSSLALSVHQGKAFTAAGAMIGALMEAVESHGAETFGFDGVTAGYRDLPKRERVAVLDDFAAVRGGGPDPAFQMRWVRARRLVDASTIWAPFDFVSLDLSFDGSPGIDRASTGLAARFDVEGATLAGLLEVLERDAYAEWRASPLAFRVARAIDVRSVGYRWFGDIRAALEEAGIRLHLYSLRSVVGAPAVAVELLEPQAQPCPRAFAGGYCCRLTAEDALRGALLEALQSRLTLIAGARDDVLYDVQVAGVLLGSGCPVPPQLRPRRWSEVERAAEAFADLSARDLGRLLAGHGYPDAAAVAITASDEPAVVVKVLVPGLGDEARSRRPPQVVH